MATVEERKVSAAAIRAKHPDRIPVIVDKRAGDSSLPDIDKKKFLVPADLTIGQVQIGTPNDALACDARAVLTYCLRSSRAVHWTAHVRYP